MTIRLEADSTGFECPHCKEKWSVEDWDTEYNQPQIGQSSVQCPSCNKNFTIETTIHINSF